MARLLLKLVPVSAFASPNSFVSGLHLEDVLLINLKLEKVVEHHLGFRKLVPDGASIGLLTICILGHHLG